MHSEQEEEQTSECSHVQCLTQLLSFSITPLSLPHKYTTKSYPDQRVSHTHTHTHSQNTMVKCLIRIKTKVNVHLRMINHCYRDVKVRVLTLGPRLLGNVLGALPIIPSLPESSNSSGISLSPYGRSHRATGNT